MKHYVPGFYLVGNYYALKSPYRNRTQAWAELGQAVAVVGAPAANDDYGDAQPAFCDFSYLFGNQR